MAEAIFIGIFIGAFFFAAFGNPERSFHLWLAEAVLGGAFGGFCAWLLVAAAL